ncbi:MAG: hypothetical protein R3D02_11245 [Hyphomicrobiales bacterium]
MPDRTEQDMEDLFAAIRDAKAVERNANAMPAVSAARLVRYGNRTDAVVDLEVERLLRASTAARLMYGTTLGRSARSVSPMAAAAAGERATRRMIGEDLLEIIDEDNAVFLVLRLADAEPAPGHIEIRTPDGDGVRIRLGKPVRGIIQLRLDDGDAEQTRIADLVTRPDSAIYLLP